MSAANPPEPSLVGRLPKVRDCMDTRVHTLSPETDILEAVRSLLRQRVTGAPVVDEAGHVLGMLTEKDCLKLIVRGVDAELPEGKVADFMETEITTVPPDMDVYFAAGLFLKHAFRRLPVVENDRLIGAITRFDILRVIRANLG
jgi:CBS domain-containing protein